MLALLERADLGLESHDLGTIARRAHQGVHRRESDVVGEERELFRVVAVGVPGEPVVAAHAEDTARLVDHPGALGTGLEGLLVAVDHLGGQVELGSVCDRCILELEGGHTRHVALQHHVEALLIHEGSVLDRVESGDERVPDSLGGAAVPEHLAPVVVGDLHDRFHLSVGHRQRVLIVGAGRRGIARRVGLQPVGAVLHQPASRRAGLVGTVDDEDHALHPDLAELGVPVHQPAGAADLLSARDEARSGNEVGVDRLGEGHVGVEEASGRTGRRVAAFECQPRVERCMQ